MQYELTTKKLRSGNEDGLSVINVEGKGRGVMCTCTFQKGQLVCEYSGQLVTSSEAKKREKRYRRDQSIGCYMYYF